MDTSEQQGQLPAQETTLISSSVFAEMATPCQKDVQRQRPPPGQLQQAWSRTISLMAVWDCCMLRCEAFKWEWVQKNALQLMTFPTLTRRMVGELKLENLMQRSELLFPTGFVFKKRKHRICAKVQHNGAEKKIEVEPSEGWRYIVPTDFLFTVKASVSKQVFC